MLKKLIRSASGAHVPHNKNTANMQTVVMPVPAKITMLMKQHLGAPCECLVKKGDAVFVGSLIGKAGGFISADIHSSVSGTVNSIGEILTASGETVQTVVIDTDGNQTECPELSVPQVTNKDELIEAARACGLVGLGGAGFPTSVKLNPKNLDEIDTLLINGAECEPYITADNREFLENAELVMFGLETIKKHLNIARVIIAIERNKPEAIDKMYEVTKGKSDFVVHPLNSVYPQGAEKVLIESATGREVPRGELPSAVGCIVMNVSTVAAFAKYLKTGMPLTTKRLTVDGDAVATPQNVQVCIGTSVQDVIDFCGGTTKTVGKVITGGPMMGVALVGTDMPIIKQNNAILVFGEKMAIIPEKSACIRCGRCISACPMGLSPVEIENAFDAKDVKTLDTLMTDLCMSCGCCSFVCPAKRPLAQTINLAKNLQRDGGKK